jgi:hypothetical protein
MPQKPQVPSAPKAKKKRFRSLSILGELWAFLRERKRWWLAPILLLLVLMGLLIIFTESSVFAPFIYTLF